MNKFNWQVFISLNLLFSFLIMLLSGIILYLKPEGSVARWLDWEMLFIGKAGWEALHTLFSFLFAIFALLHILYIHLPNIFNYTRTKSFNTSAEVYLSLAITILFLAGTLANVIPFSSVYKAGNHLSDTWQQKYTSPQEGVEARTTLEEYAQLNHLSVDTLMRTLHEAGMRQVKPQMTFVEIAGLSDLEPYEVYSVLSGIEYVENELVSEEYTGRITIGDIAFMYSLDQEKALKLLREKMNNPDLQSETSLKTIAIHEKLSLSEVRDDILSILKRGK